MVRVGKEFTGKDAEVSAKAVTEDRMSEVVYFVNAYSAVPQC